MIDRSVNAKKSLSIVAAVFLAGVGSPGSAHHPIAGKFDAAQSTTLAGIVTYVDWRNPHAHVFVDVKDAEGSAIWAIELASPVELDANGWSAQTLEPGDSVVVEGIRARDGTRQVWGESVRREDSKRELFAIADSAPRLPLTSRPAPRWPDGQIALGATPGSAGGYWAHPSKTTLVEDGVDVEFDTDALLVDLDDADDVAPLQPWALGLYRFRQQRQLRDDPTYLNCKPPGGPRQYLSPLGFQLIEDRANRRVFVLMGSGNHNYRIIYLDAREQAGQVGGDDDNPLYYGRSVGRWEGDTLVVNTTGFNEDFWFSPGGLPHTDRLELVERFTRSDYDTLQYQVTINDPGAYRREWTASWTLSWVGGQELPVHFCQHNRP
jgi:hypothetical protein